MFSENDIELLRQSPYKVIQANHHHDVTIHSLTTGHDWSIVTSYEYPIQAVISCTGTQGGTRITGSRGDTSPQKKHWIISKTTIGGL